MQLHFQLNNNPKPVQLDTDIDYQAIEKISKSVTVSNLNQNINLSERIEKFISQLKLNAQPNTPYTMMTIVKFASQNDLDLKTALGQLGEEIKNEQIDPNLFTNDVLATIFKKDFAQQFMKEKALEFKEYSQEQIQAMKGVYEVRSTQVLNEKLAQSSSTSNVIANPINPPQAQQQPQNPNNNFFSPMRARQRMKP